MVFESLGFLVVNLKLTTIDVGENAAESAPATTSEPSHVLHSLHIKHQSKTRSSMSMVFWYSAQELPVNCNYRLCIFVLQLG
jgi:hypothetical protein